MLVPYITQPLNFLINAEEEQTGSGREERNGEDQAACSLVCHSNSHSGYSQALEKLWKYRAGHSSSWLASSLQTLTSHWTRGWERTLEGGDALPV